MGALYDDDELGFAKVCTRWVLSRSTPKQVEFIHLQVCFWIILPQLIKTWVHHSTPEWNEQVSKEWWKKEEEGPVKAKSRLLAGMIISTILFYRRDLLCIQFLPEL